jgi:hypothetical protein
MLIVMSGFNDTRRVRPWGATPGLLSRLDTISVKKKTAVSNTTAPSTGRFPSPRVKRLGSPHPWHYLSQNQRFNDPDPVHVPQTET